MDRDVVNSLLKKLGVKSPETQQNPETKLKRRLEHKGIPADLTDAEKELVEGMGFPIESEKEVEEVEKRLADSDDKAVALKIVKKPAKAVESKPKTKNTKKEPAKPAKVKAEKKMPKSSPGKKGKVGRKKGSNNSTGGFFTLREIFKNRKGIEKKVLLDQIVQKGGCSLISAQNYVSMAKNGANKMKFGFTLTEEKKKDGTKVLTKHE